MHLNAATFMVKFPPVPSDILPHSQIPVCVGRIDGWKEGEENPVLQISQSVGEVELSLLENLEADLHFQPNRRAIYLFIIF